MKQVTLVAAVFISAGLIAPGGGSTPAAGNITGKIKFTNFRSYYPFHIKENSKVIQAAHAPFEALSVIVMMVVEPTMPTSGFVPPPLHTTGCPPEVRAEALVPSV